LKIDIFTYPFKKMELYLSVVKNHSYSSQDYNCC